MLQTYVLSIGFLKLSWVFQFPWYSQTVCTTLIKKSADFLHVRENLILKCCLLADKQKANLTAVRGQIHIFRAITPNLQLFSIPQLFQFCDTPPSLLLPALRIFLTTVRSEEQKHKHSVLLLIFISREIDQNARKILRSTNPIVTAVSVDTLFVQQLHICVLSWYTRPLMFYCISVFQHQQKKVLIFHLLFVF